MMPWRTWTEEIFLTGKVARSLITTPSSNLTLVGVISIFWERHRSQRRPPGDRGDEKEWRSGEAEREENDRENSGWDRQNRDRVWFRVHGHPSGSSLNDSCIKYPHQWAQFLPAALVQFAEIENFIPLARVPRQSGREVEHDASLRDSDE
jgi:hypothetical protein